MHKIKTHVSLSFFFLFFFLSPAFPPPCRNLPGHFSAGRPGEDEGGAEDGHHVSAGAWARRRARRAELGGRGRAGQRRRQQPAQRRGARHRGGEERPREETAAGTHTHSSSREEEEEKNTLKVCRASNGKNTKSCQVYFCLVSNADILVRLI